MRKKTKPQKPLYKDSSMEKIAIFPGSFDPFTKGHESLLRRGLTLFDRIIIGVGINEYKRMEQSTEKRIAALRKLFAGDERIQVEGYSDLTVDFAARHHARFILRGIRSIKDYEYEMNIADLNRRLTGVDYYLVHRTGMGVHQFHDGEGTYALREGHITLYPGGTRI